MHMLKEFHDLKKFFVFICLALLFVFVSGLTSSFASRKNQCLRCHMNLTEAKKNIHPVFKLDCGICHVKVRGKEHPLHNESIKLKTNIPALCYDCHKESKFKGKTVHPPVKQGSCVSCHDAHSSEHGLLLKSSPPELCYNCHDRRKFTKEYPHKVSLAGCSKRCHTPHASDKRFLLPQEINDLCISCHRAQETGRHIVSLTGGRIHPIEGVRDPKRLKRELSCSSCHNPHSSKYTKLFVSKNICKRCHKFY